MSKPEDRTKTSAILRRMLSPTGGLVLTPDRVLDLLMLIESDEYILSQQERIISELERGISELRDAWARKPPRT